MRRHTRPEARHVTLGCVGGSPCIATDTSRTFRHEGADRRHGPDGHINPLLAVGRLLSARGDTVVVTTAEAFRGKIEAAGLRFSPIDDGHAAEYRETSLPAGPERYRREFERRFIDPMLVQAEALRSAIAVEQPDVIVAGSLFLGVLPLLLGSDPRPPIVVLNVSFLFLDRPDDAPVGLGLPPARSADERAHYALLKAGMDAAFVDPVRAYADAQLARFGCRLCRPRCRTPSPCCRTCFSSRPYPTSSTILGSCRPTCASSACCRR